MFSDSERFISRTKLRELHKQRDYLRVAYDSLSLQVAEAEDDVLGLRLLYEGLQELRVANQRLHPDVANLDMLLYQMTLGQASSEMVRFWRTRLEEELTRGRLRSEVVYLFGRLLAESATQTMAASSDDAEQAVIHEQLLAQVSRASQPTDDEGDEGYEGLLEPLLDTLLGDLESEMGTQLGALMADEVRVPVTSYELLPILRGLSHDLYRAPLLRAEAKHFLADEALRRELADALTIELANLDEWMWPLEGVATQAVWTRNKWRLYLKPELPIACLLEVVGVRWQSLLKRLVSKQIDARKPSLEPIAMLPAMFSSEGYLFPRRVRRHLTVGRDIWAKQEDEEVFDMALRQGEDGSIFQQRAEMQSKLRDIRPLDAYQQEPYSHNMQTALILINAEIELARAAFPEQSLFVVKVDLQNFYPSISHDLLQYVLGKIGLSDSDLRFFERFMRPPLLNSSTAIAQGIPNDYRLSHFLGELLLSLLDQHIQQAARVLVIRMIDDICLLAPSAKEALAAWQAIEGFCVACGLGINEAKCGAVAIGGTLPTGLPTTPPTWQLLQLEADGSWNVNQSAWEAHLLQTRESIVAASSLLVRIASYNANLNYLVNALAISAPLGEAHRERIASAISRFHHQLFGPEEGIEHLVWQEIRQWLGESEISLPEAWLYWPITAGGLGLTQADLLAGQYAQSYIPLKGDAPQKRPDNWQRRQNEWARFYGARLRTVEPQQPTETTLMETLVRDFIQRGSQLTGGKQQTLSSYWHWLLYSYGPQILTHFGTFHFLITQLVPLQLISQRNMGNSSLFEQRRSVQEVSRIAAEEIPF